MWREPEVDFEGCYYQLSHTYYEPKPLQKPTPPFILGDMGEQLTLRVVAQHADVWNFPGLPGLPHGAVEEFQSKNHILDGYCTEIERNPATLGRSVQLLIDPREKPVTTRQIIYDFIAAGATHFVLAPRTLGEGIIVGLDFFFPQRNL